MDRLSPREREVVALIAHGHTDGTAAAVLGLAQETVRTHVQNARTRLQVQTRSQLTAIWAAEEAERLIWQQLTPYERHSYYERRRRAQRKDDLEVVVRDQAAHIVNLEAQLLGLQGPQPIGEQEALA